MLGHHWQSRLMEGAAMGGQRLSHCGIALGTGMGTRVMDKQMPEQTATAKYKGSVLT